MKNTRALAMLTASLLMGTAFSFPSAKPLTALTLTASAEDSNALPYTFAELLSMDDAAFLDDPAVSNAMKKAFRRTRDCERFGVPQLIFRLADDTALPDDASAQKTAICDILGIPETLVGEIGTYDYYGGTYPLRLQFAQDCDAYTANRVVIWLTFQSGLAAMQHHYQGDFGALGFDMEDWQSYYDLPYSFAEFLALEDAAILDDAQVPEDVKKHYRELREKEPEMLCSVTLRFEDGVTLDGAPSDADFGEKLLARLGIPAELVASVTQSPMFKDDIQLAFHRYAPTDTVLGYPAPYVYNKVLIYLYNHPDIGMVLYDTAQYYAPDTAKNWAYYAELDDMAVYRDYCELYGLTPDDALPDAEKLFPMYGQYPESFRSMEVYLGDVSLPSGAKMQEKGAAYFGFPADWFEGNAPALELSHSGTNYMELTLSTQAEETKHFTDNYLNRCRAELTLRNSAFAQEYVIHSIGTPLPAWNDVPAETLKKGDVNEDGTIDIMDVIRLNRYLLGSETLTKAQSAAADVDGNDTLDSTDSLLILKYTVELIDHFDA